ncbi:MAG TPA: molybdenum ABC transporter permease [Lentisphaeria bacterium]|nr:MAG: molybdenum ABC transporter permease [Lentisphaerae bacterium GWF2_38_69]HBM17075.1 molybdenum ABC transporter permease [Lentisphaeria bacterium]
MRRLQIDYRAFPIILLFIILAVIAVSFYNIKMEDVSKLLKNKEFLYSVLFSLQTSFFATLFAFVFGFPSGLYLARNRSALSDIVDVIVDIPMVLPPLIVGVLLITFLKSTYIENIYTFIFTPSGAVAAQFIVALPLIIKASKSSFELVPQIYETIAMTLGSKPCKAFYDTTFKIAFRGIMSGVVLAWLRCMGEFGATLLIGGGIPYKTENIPINIYINISSGDFSMGMAASVLSIGIVIIFVVIIKFLTIKRF